MRVLFPAILAGIVAAVVPATAQQRVNSDSVAASHVGESVTVEGTVASVHVTRSGTTFLNFGAAYPDQTFTAVIFRAASSKFPNPRQWEGKRVRVTGAIRLYRGTPEIILDGPSQLTAAQ